jgi:cell division protein FtsB
MLRATPARPPSRGAPEPATQSPPPRARHPEQESDDVTAQTRWQERQQLRRLERHRRRGGDGRGPVALQRAAGRLSSAGRAVRRRAARAVRGDRPLVVVLLGALVLAVVLLSGPAQSYLDGRARVASLEAKVGALEAENARLSQRVEDLQDPEKLELLAREQQGFILPGEVPYTLTPPEVERPQITAPRGSGPTTAEPWYERVWSTVQGWLG